LTSVISALTEEDIFARYINFPDNTKKPDIKQKARNLILIWIRI
jgi:hypothetical protein